jgi:DNA-binding MarR family transcriptional regulator
VSYETDESNPRYRALMELLRAADTVWNASHAFFGRWELGPSQFNILNLLYSTKDGLSQTELGRQLIMHRSNVTGLVDRLEKRGLVERHDVASDRRAYKVVLTPAGVRLMEEVLPQYYERAIRVSEGLSSRRVASLAADLQMLTRNVERLAGEQAGKLEPEVR